MLQKSSEKGRALVEKLLREGRLQLVDAQPECAQELVTQARISYLHLPSHHKTALGHSSFSSTARGKQ